MPSISLLLFVNLVNIRAVSVFNVTDKEGMKLKDKAAIAQIEDYIRKVCNPESTRSNLAIFSSPVMYYDSPTFQLTDN